MKVDELEALKYRQLQKLAKEKGVKANLPRSALIDSLLESMLEVQEEPSPKRDEDESSVLLSSSSGEQEKTGNSTIDLITDQSSSGSRRSSRKKESLEKSKTSTEIKADLNVSLKPNSRLSRLFDKEAFEIEAAKVSRYAQQIVNSPRKRSSILNMTPLSKGQSTSLVNSPLVAPTPKKTLDKISSPLVTSTKTPLHKRPSMTGKTTEIKKKKTVTLKTATPSGSVTKAKNLTGIPRPRKVPNFAAMHAKQFNKMDTLGQYLDKKKERVAALTPGPKKKPASPKPAASKFNPNIKASINFVDDASASAKKKPFVFKASQPSASNSKVLDNITNTKTATKYKPYTGKVKPWNAKDASANRQQMGNKTASARNVKEQQMSIIKGVRMNKRMELMMKKRGAAATKN